MTGAALWPQVNSSASYQRRQSVETPASGGPSGRGTAVLSQNGLQGISVTGSTPGGPSVTLSPDLSGQGNTTVSVSMGTEGAAKPPSRYSNLYQAGFDASWELDLFGGVRRATEAARAEIEAAEESRRSLLLMVAAEVARTYFDLRAYQNRLDISRKNIRTLEESLELVTARFNAGLTNELDVKRAEAQLATTRSTLPAMEYYVEQAIHRLGILSGREPGALRQELADAAPLPPAPPEVLVGLPSELLSRRPDVRFAERELAAATARIGVATADLFPRFSLTGSFSGADDTLAGLRLGANHLWSIGPAVQWPVFDAGRIRANIRIQNARQEQALLAYEKAVLYSLEDVENALVRYAKEQNRLVELTAAVQASQKALDIADDLYKQGLVNFLNVLDAQRTLFAAQDQRVQSQANVLTSLVALYKALGGGWETPLELGEPAADTTTSAEQDSQHGLS
ncbi:MAG: Toluene efflux pump outer membrane protein TtgI precursor [Candidatus Hydrogenedentes bacterium ADurb.Bin179]|nr:MAG: Toluene efflux pump outer membrane protein TtgI precursor [Candidatus Hydrogenedentes bacterium ADurb.Bin179]